MPTSRRWRSNTAERSSALTVTSSDSVSRSSSPADPGSDALELDRDQQAVPDLHQAAQQAFVLAYRLQGGADRNRLILVVARIGGPVVPEHVVDHQQSAVPQQPKRLLDVLRVL